MTLANILAMNDGPEKKLRLIEMIGNVYRHSTERDPRALSCAELVQWITANLVPAERVQQ